MKEGGIGGANTKTGIVFEGEVDFLDFIGKQNGYSIKENVIFYHGEEVGSTYKKYSLYRFLKSWGIFYEEFISKKLLPDDAIFVIANNTMHI